MTLAYCSSGIADIIDDVHSVRQPTAAELEVEASAILEDVVAQQRAGEAAEAARRAQLEAIPKSEVQLAKMAARKAKAAEEEERRRRAAEAAATSVADDPGFEEGVVHVAAPPAKETQAAGLPPPQSYTVSIATDSASHAYYDPEPVTYSTLAAARAAGVWTYPATAAERARAGVFRALWERGYYMGTGIKFGGDLLVYPGAFRSEPTRALGLCSRPLGADALLTLPLRYLQAILCVTTLTSRRPQSSQLIIA